MSDLRDMAARLRAAADALDAVQQVGDNRIEQRRDLDEDIASINPSETQHMPTMKKKRHLTAEHKVAISRAWARRRRAAKKA